MKKTKKILLLSLQLFFLLNLTISSLASEPAQLAFKGLWPSLKQPWYFNYPTDTAFDSQGNVYITDSSNHRIQKFSPTGSFITKWGSSGSETGEFSYPGSLAVDNNDKVYVADTQNDRIQKFTSDGEFIDSWGINGKGEKSDPELRWQPFGIDIDHDGHLYITGLSTRTIRKYTTKGLFLKSWSIQENSMGQVTSDETKLLFLAVGPNGKIHVADSKNNCIQVFASDGTWISKFGSSGSKEGEFDFPSGITIDDQGDIFVMDSNNCRIQRFSSDGSILSTWGSYGHGPGEFNFGLGLGMGNQGNLYVADGYANTIQEFSSDGFVLNVWKSTGEGNGKFNIPTDIASDSSGNVYVSDKDNFMIHKFSPQGDFLASLGGWGENEDNFQTLFGITVDKDDNLIAVGSEDPSEVKIKKFSSIGTLISSWSCHKREDAQAPMGITSDDKGNLYLSDSASSLIYKFSRDGALIATWGTLGSFSHPTGMTFDDKGYIYVADTNNHRIQVLSQEGNPIRSWGGYGTGENQFNLPEDIALDGKGNIYVLDTGNHRIQIFTPEGDFMATFGNHGSDPGQFSSPSGICTGINNRIYVADSLNNRIQLFSSQADGNDNGSITSGKSKAIIVAGGGPYTGNTLWNVTQLCANFSYRVLTHKGFTKDNIFYLSQDRDLDLDNNGLADDVDAYATNLNLHDAITQWGKDADDLTIYITNHGGDGRFRMSESEVLEAESLDSWLDQLQEPPGPQVTLIYDACQSGSFLPFLANESSENRPKRIVMASADAHQNAYFTSAGTISFSYFFWGAIFNGMTLYDAYLSSRNSTQYAYGLQTPMLDADGNGIGNQDQDMESIQGLHIGSDSPTLSADDIPYITAISPETTLTGETSHLIFAENIIAANEISRVWSVISPPENDTADPSHPVLELPEVEMIQMGKNRYEGSYQHFDKKGRYNISIFARTINGTLSIPRQTSLVQTLGEAPQQDGATADTDLSVNIPCLNVQDAFYSLHLTLYHHPVDQNNIYWKYDHSAQMSCPDNPGQAYLNRDMSITIPDLRYGGTSYALELIYYQNPFDPFNLPCWILGDIRLLR